MLKNSIEKFLAITLKKVFRNKKLSLHEPLFTGKEWKLIKSVIQQRNVSALGEEKKKFLKILKYITKSKYIILVSSGTAALYVSLKMLGIKKNDEVLIPNLNYIASTNAIISLGAIPHLIDTEKNTYGPDAKKLNIYLEKNTKIVNGKCVNLKTRNRIIGIVPTYIFGNAYDIDSIKKICKKFSLSLIEDSAEALGTYYKKKHAGTFGSAGILSFNGNKIITTGGGGAILLKKKKDYKLAKKFIDNAKKLSATEFNYYFPSFNFEMPNINATLGYSQIKNLKKILEYKKNISLKLNKFFLKQEFFKFNIPESKNVIWNNWLQSIYLNDNMVKYRKKIFQYASRRNIYLRPAWKLLSNLDQKYFKFIKMNNLENSKKHFERIICIPSCSQTTFKAYINK